MSPIPATVLVFAASTFAQNAPEAHPKFDAATVKLDNRGIRVGLNVAMRGGPGTSDPGLFSLSYGQPLKLLISKAWDMPSDQIAGPSWLDDSPGNLYLISATLPPGTTKEQFLLMWQDLLIERFHLALHRETKNFPGYDLVVAGKPKLTEWKPDPVAAQPPPGLNPGNDEQGFPRLRPNAQVGVNPVHHDGSPLWTIHETHHQSMPDFAKGLGQTLKQAGVAGVDGPLARVADKTGLSGLWEFRLQFEGTMTGSAPAASDQGTDSLSIFTEIEKQLGLKLVKTKGVPVDILVIDHAEKTPEEN